MLWEQRYSHDWYTGMHPTVGVHYDAEYTLCRQLLASDDLSLLGVNT